MLSGSTAGVWRGKEETVNKEREGERERRQVGEEDVHEGKV